MGGKRNGGVDQPSGLDSTLRSSGVQQSLNLPRSFAPIIIFLNALVV
jgi:hypothetical protein